LSNPRSPGIRLESRPGVICRKEPGTHREYRAESLFSGRVHSQFIFRITTSWH
jgi:hypothetical protein